MAPGSQSGLQPARGQCLIGAPSSCVDQSRAGQSSCVHLRLLRQGTGLPRRRIKEKPDQMCCSFEGPSFSGHCGQRTGCAGEAEHLSWRCLRGHIPLPPPGASRAEGSLTLCQRNRVGRTVPLMSVMSAFVGTPR